MNKIILIGEKINATRKVIKEAIEKRDKKVILKEAEEQISKGVDYLDVNAGFSPEKEIENLCWLVNVLQENFAIPLCIDSSNPEAILSAISIYKGKKAIINSITLKEEKYKKILPTVKKNNFQVIALCIKEGDFLQTPNERINSAKEIIKIVKEYEVPLSSLFIDPLVYPVSTNTKEGLNTLQTIKEIKEFEKEVKIVVGLSNISFGLPKRNFLNAVFLALCMREGIDGVILDPTEKTVMSVFFAARTLLGMDEYCKDYISFYRKGEIL